MDCKRVDQELIAFHLAALDGATRAAVEAHLCACGRCVGAYLMLKRAIDGGEDSPAPSETVRARVLAAARATLAPAASATTASPPRTAASAPARTPRRTLAWATAAAAMLVAAPLIYRATAPRPSAPVGAPSGAPSPAPARNAPLNTGTVDSARAMPESLKYL